MKVDWLKLRRKILYYYYFAIFAIINEKLIKEDRPICVSRSARRSGEWGRSGESGSHSNIL